MPTFFHAHPDIDIYMDANIIFFDGDSNWLTASCTMWFNNLPTFRTKTQHLRFLVVYFTITSFTSASLTDFVHVKSSKKCIQKISDITQQFFRFLPNQSQTQTLGFINVVLPSKRRTCRFSDPCFFETRLEHQVVQSLFFLCNSFHIKVPVKDFFEFIKFRYGFCKLIVIHVKSSIILVANNNPCTIHNRILPLATIGTTVIRIISWCPFEKGQRFASTMSAFVHVKSQSSPPCFIAISPSNHNAAQGNKPLSSLQMCSATLVSKAM